MVILVPVKFFNLDFGPCKKKSTEFAPVKFKSIDFSPSFNLSEKKTITWHGSVTWQMPCCIHVTRQHFILFFGEKKKMLRD
jgi:hypothetical protein